MYMVDDKKKKTTLIVIVVACIAVIFLFFFKVYIDFSSEDVVINKGVLNFDSRKLKDNEVVSLSGEWEFYWKQFLTHDDFIKRLQQDCFFVKVPKVWNDYTINNKHLSGYGYGTYRLHVNYANAESELAIRMPTVSTAYKLYVDGTLLSSNGKISKDENGFEPGYQPNVVTFKPKNKEFDIIIQVANYSYARGGMWYQPFLGTSKSILNIDQTIQIKDLMLIGAFLMLAVYHMLMFILRRNEKSNLILAFFSLCATIRVMIYGDYSINYLIPQISFYEIVKLDYITVSLLPFLGILFVDDVFKKLNIIKFKEYILVFSLFLVSLVLLLPIHIFTHFSLIYQSSSFLIGLYASIFIIKNLKHYDIEKVLFFLGLVIIIIISALYDTLYQDNIIKSNYGELSPIGIMIFLIIQSLILAIKNCRAYDELSSAKIKLEQLDILKNEFLENTAHELRTPLNAIINICEGMYRDTEKHFSKFQQESLSMVIKCGKRLSLVVNEILDYSKLKNLNAILNLEELSLYIIAKHVVNELRCLNSNKDIQLIVDISPEISNVLADRNRLIQIFYNLIGNAIKNTEKGYIKVTALPYGEFVKIAIINTGKGISKDKLSTFFEPYFQVASNQCSANDIGLGLAITKKLVEAHGGQIYIKSKEGEETTVSFTIPIYKGKKTEVTNQYDELTVRLNDDYKDVLQIPYVHNGNGPTVAIVDDNEVNLISMIGILKSNDYSILAFNRVDDFYSVFKNKSSDLIILDVMLPELSGYQICESIRKNYSISELPILMLTAKTATKDIVHGLKSGANDYLAKPFDADEFLARVRTLIQMKLSVEKMRASELAFLRAQIKPHFLFNAINTVITISRYDVERAVSLMISFSQYLRKSFDFKDTSQTTSLSDELELLKAYLEIEQARFEERLEIELDLTKQLDIQIPILMLQPIVENAIIHGVLPKIEGGKVTISIKVEGDRVSFNVKDNGIGMDVNKINTNENFNAKTSIGLKNINSRLKKLYGKELIIKSELNVGTSVSWSIPIKY